MVKWIVMPPRKFTREHRPGAIGEHFTTEEGEHVVVIPRGASTRTKLHELAHAKLGHTGFAKTYGETAKRELAADSWVYEKLGREPTLRELVSDFGPGIEELMERGYRRNQVFTWLKKELEDSGYTLDKEDRSELWGWIKGKYELVKGK